LASLRDGFATLTGTRWRRPQKLPVIGHKGQTIKGARAMNETTITLAGNLVATRSCATRQPVSRW
jgi:hypothetical protein